AHLPAPDRDRLRRQTGILLADEERIDAFHHVGGFVGEQIEDADIHAAALLLGMHSPGVQAVSAMSKVPERYQFAINCQSIPAMALTIVSLQCNLPSS